MPAILQEFFVPDGPGEAEYLEKRSRFIARVWPAATESRALSFIAAMREKHRDATHNVYAYLVKDGQTRCSDDGEPQGTSGPVLNVFQSEKIYNVCCVVTRYYGGIPLGAGGLAGAYSKTAKMALDAAGISIMRQWDVVIVPCPYALFDRIKARTAACGGIIQSSEFTADILLTALTPVGETALFLQDIQDISAGSVEAVVVNTVFRKAKIR